LPWGEFSYESDEIQNGCFTSEILHVLAQPATDREDSGMIGIEELRASVGASVPRLTEDLQHPTVDRDNRKLKFGFPVCAQ
jgi:hypothetical protein